MEQVMSLVGSVDKKTWLIIGVVLALLAVVSLVKKAIKLGLLILAIAFVVTFGGSFVSGIQDKLGVSIEDSVLHIDNELVGTYDIDLDSVQNVIIKNGNSTKNVIVDIAMNNKTQTVEMPEKVLWVLNTILDKADIDTVDLRK